MSKKLFLLVLLIAAYIAYPQFADAQTYNVSSCASIPNPVEGQTFCFEASTNTLKKYESGVWVDMVGAGYNRIQEEGSNLAQESILNFIGAGVTCVAGTGKTECTFSGSGSGSQHQVDGVNVTTNDPINYRDTATIEATNPSAGNIDFNIVADSITNSHINSAAAIAATKISGTAVVQSRTISTTSPLTGGGDLSTNRTITFSSQTANTVLSGPTSGGSAVPAFRALVDADIPSAIARDSEINVQGTASQICSTGSGVAPTLSICSAFRIGGITATAPFTINATRPATCTVGDYHFDSDAPAGQNTYACTSTNTWTLQGGAGGGVESDPIVAAISGIVKSNGTTISAAVANVDYAGITHASRHQNGGADEIATATPGNNAIPKAGATGVLAGGWIDQTADYAFTGTMFDGVTLANLPAASVGKFIWVTDCNGLTSCGEGGGTTRILYYSDGTDWLPLYPLGAANVPTLGQSFNVPSGNLISGANESKPLSLRGSGGGATYGWDWYVDSTNVPQSKCVIAGVVDDCNYMRTIPSCKKAGFQNSSSADIFAIYETGVALLKTMAAPSTPAAGYGSIYIDSTTKQLCNKDDAGVVGCLASAASSTVAGIVELAIASEVDTGTDATRAVTPDSLAGSTVFGRKVVQMVIFDSDTAVSTGDKKGIFTVPVELNGMNLVAVSAHVDTVSSSGAITIDLARCAVVATGNSCSGTVSDMLSVNLTIDENESKSASATTAVTIDTSNDDVATDQVIRVDVDGAGTGAQGLYLTMSFQLP